MAGRAGRGQKPGHVYIQTHQPEAPVLAALVAGVGLPAAHAVERWNMSVEQPDGNYIAGVARDFAADVARLSNGELEIKTHSNSVLFKRPELKRAVQTGQVQVGDVLISVLGNEDALYEVDAVPLLARDFDSAWKLWQASRPGIEARLDEFPASRAANEGRKTEVGLEILRRAAARREDASQQLRDIGSQELELAERRRALAERIDRLDIRAPVGGVVLGLQLTTPRAVLDTLWGCLKPGGVLVLQTQRVLGDERFKTWRYRHDPTHIVFFAEASFQVLAARGPQVLMSTRDHSANGMLAVQDLAPIFQSTEVRQIHAYLLKQHGKRAMSDAEKQRDRLLDQMAQQAQALVRERLIVH